MIFIVHWRDRARICLSTRSQSSVKIDKEKGKDIYKGNIHLSHISEHLMHFIPTSKSTFAANLQLFFNKKKSPFRKPLSSIRTGYYASDQLKLQFSIELLRRLNGLNKYLTKSAAWSINFQSFLPNIHPYRFATNQENLANLIYVYVSKSYRSVTQTLTSIFARHQLCHELTQRQLESAQRISLNDVSSTISYLFFWWQGNENVKFQRICFRSLSYALTERGKMVGRVYVHIEQSIQIIGSNRTRVSRCSFVL